MNFTASQFGQKSALHSILAEAFADRSNDHSSLQPQSQHSGRKTPHQPHWNRTSSAGDRNARAEYGRAGPGGIQPQGSSQRGFQGGRSPHSASGTRPSLHEMNNQTPVSSYNPAVRSYPKQPRRSSPPSSAVDTPCPDSRCSSSHAAAKAAPLNSGPANSSQLPSTEQATPPLRATSKKVDPLVTLRRRLKANLNKLTLEQFPVIVDRIIEFCATSITTFEQVQILTDLVVDTAMLEQQFSEMYSDLILVLKHRCPKVPAPRPEDASQAKWNPIQGAIYVKLQHEYETLPKSLDDLSGVQSPGQTSLEEDDEARTKLKLRTVGLFILTGHLFNRGMIGLRLLRTIITMQLMATEKPEEDYIECVCRLLLTVGATCDASLNGQKLLDQTESRLHELGQDTGKRLVFLISDVTEARQRGWAKKPPPTRPKRAEVAQHEDASSTSMVTSEGHLGKPSYLMDPDSPYSRYVLSQINFQSTSEQEQTVGNSLHSAQPSSSSSARVTFPEPIFKVRPYNPQEPVRPTDCDEDDVGESSRRLSESSQVPFSDSSQVAPPESSQMPLPLSCDYSPFGHESAAEGASLSPSVRFDVSKRTGFNASTAFIRRPPTPMRGPTTDVDDPDSSD